MAGPSPLRSFTKVALLALAASLVLTVLLKPGGRGGAHYSGYLPPGQSMPDLRAAGWLNGEAPPPESLKGKVVVLDAWATWCGPCRAAMPDVVALHKRYGDRVVFIGLTTEGPEEAENIQNVLDSYDAKWLNGYGANDVLTELGADYIPAYWVIDTDGNIVWNSNSGTMEEGIELALRKHEG